MPQDFIEQFIADTIQKAGYADLPETFLQPYKDKLELLLVKRIGLDATVLLDEESLEEFADLITQPTTKPEAVFAFYKARIDNFPEKIIKTLIDFQKQYLNLAQQVIN